MSKAQKKKRLREGGVGPEMRSPAGLALIIVVTDGFPVKVFDPLTAEKSE